jgi:hypothetical protein
MRTLNRVTEEFVRHHSLLMERTGNDPSRMATALGEHPEPAASIERLREIGQAIERHRYHSKLRFIPQAHEEFRRAVQDALERWASAFDEVRNQRYMQAALRISEEFRRCFLFLKESTANDPTAVVSLRNQTPDLDRAITWTDEIMYALDEPKGYGEWKKSYSDDVVKFVAKTREVARLLTDISPEFREARTDYELRWAKVCEFIPSSLEDSFILLREEQKNSLHNVVTGAFGDHWLEQLINSLPDTPDTSATRAFDPSRDSAADAVMWAEDLFSQETTEIIEYPAEEAFEWIHKTVGLDLFEIERRWKEFLVIVVPHHVSDQYGLESPHGLYAYLTQVRLAYMIGADLAAVALCRSITELLIRHHYAHDIPNATVSKGKKRTGLEWLIDQVQAKAGLEFLKNLNLAAKVNEANDILHQPSADIEHRDRARGLVTQWVMCLQEMIDRAPPSRVAVGR